MSEKGSVDDSRACCALIAGVAALGAVPVVVVAVISDLSLIVTCPGCLPDEHTEVNDRTPSRASSTRDEVLPVQAAPPCDVSDRKVSRMSFWDVVWLLLLSYLFLAYLTLLFSVLSDLLRDDETGGVVKALWVVFLVFLPFLALLAYLVVRGRGMAGRSAAAAGRNRAAVDSYVREVAGTTSPSREVAEAKALLDQQVITTQEFERLKARALA